MASYLTTGQCARLGKGMDLGFDCVVVKLLDGKKSFESSRCICCGNAVIGICVIGALGWVSWDEIRTESLEF